MLELCAWIRVCIKGAIGGGGLEFRSSYDHVFYFSVSIWRIEARTFTRSNGYRLTGLQPLDLQLLDLQPLSGGIEFP